MEERESHQSKRPECRVVRPGEMLAMHPAAIHAGPQGFFWMFGGGPKRSERKGDVALVHVRDALEHHNDSWSDNYEDIFARVSDAMTGADADRNYKQEQERHAWRYEGTKGYQPLPDKQHGPPAAVLMVVDSPGGVVSGLNETIYALRKLRKETGVPLIAYPNEMAASAGFALCCACDRIFCPASAIVGSIGVISTMVSQARKNEKDGYDVALITSGDRKADGHVLAPLTDEMVSVERERVMTLAKTFWQIASDARGISPKRLRSYQASIYLGAEAKEKGLVDGVRSLSDTIALLSQGGSSTRRKVGAGGNETDRRELTMLSLACHGVSTMALPPTPRGR